MKNITVLLIAICASLDLGCTQKFGKTLFVSNMYHGDVKRITRVVSNAKTVAGQSCGSSVFFIPLGDADIGRAVDDALSQSPGGEALADVNVEYGYTFLSVFYNRSCIKVEGEPVVFR